MSLSLSGSARPLGVAQAARVSRDAVYRAVWRWHFYAGLLCLPFLVTLSATGALYLFKDEINATVFAGRSIVAPSATPLGPDRLIFEAMQAVPGGTPLSYTDPARPDASAVVTLAEGPRRILVSLDPADGTVLDTVDRDSEFFTVVKRLHSLAYFGPLANGIIEIVAGFAIILVLTGLYLWWPRGQEGGVVTIRATPRRRVWWRDLHAVIGIVAGGGLLFLALTGLPWSVWWGDQLRHWSNAAGLGQPTILWASKPVSTVPMGQVLDSTGWTMRDAPVPRSTAGGKPIGIDEAAAILGRLGMPRGYELSLPMGPQGVYAAAVYPKDVARQRVISLDQYSGKPLVDVPFQELGPVGRLIQYGIGIHLGQYWGRANQFAMLAFCLATILLSITAATMWWKRRPKGGLGAPPWPRDRRVMAGVTALVIGLGALFPLTGLAILVMLGLDLALRRVVARRAAPAVLLCGACLVGASPARAQEAVTLDELSVTGEGGPATVRSFGVAAPPNSSSVVIDQPVGQVVTAIGRANTIADRPATSIGSVLINSPGVTVRQGNGARDVIVSIRGNNARSTGVIKNMVVLEDGFIVTQPDGASRFDITDPRAYSRIDVFRGPQSALFGNYATGGAIAFRTRTGREIDGYEYGVDAGSFGYLSNYFTVGGVSGPFEISLFASDVRGNGYQDHSSYDTQTINLLASYTPTPDNRFTLKVINNELHANLAARSSLAQYGINPYQLGCASALNAAPGCTTYNYFVNGAFGRTVAVTATEASLQRNDRRTIVGLRYEHDFDANTTWRTQLGFDERNFDQPFYTTSSTGSYPSWNFLTDLTRRGDLFGLPAVGYVALAYNRIDNHIATYNRAPYNGPSLGGLIGDQSAVQDNLGGRARMELALTDRLTAVAGISAESTRITGRNLAYSYAASGITRTVANTDRQFLNTAPELALVYRASEAWQLRARAATGYTTPAASNLFITPAGLPGNNTQLKTQENLGFDLGADWTPQPGVTVSLTGFYEFFRNELVSQSPGAGLLAYTFNAPASEHRGIEFGADWAFAPGWRAYAAYGFNDQIYTRYVEQISAGSLTRFFDRAGNTIPGVPAHQLLARIGYDVPTGSLAGLGAFVETVFQDDFYIDNANLLKAPGYAIVNANVHYETALTGGYAKRLNLYLEVRNLFDTVYVASAQNLANTISGTTGFQNGAGVLATTTGSVYAGAPRTITGGMKLSF